MSEFSPAMPHGKLTEVFPDVFWVTGTMKGEFFGSMWQFGRNMTIIREGESLTLINAVRLDDEGLAELEKLGNVVNLVKLGSMHGQDDAFYLGRYGATFWALPGMPHGEGVEVSKELSVEGELPISGASLFVFETTKLPEAILRLDKEGGIAVACDSLQNWEQPDAFTTDDTAQKMRDLGFFARANLGPAWMHVSEPKAADFARLKDISFKHALCGHGSPLRDTALTDFAATFKKYFDV